jgi:hypothetical protein
VITPEAKRLRAELLGNKAAPIAYSEERPEAVLDEDAAIARFSLDLESTDIRIFPLSEVFVENE